MRFLEGKLILAATDLSGFSACAHKTLLDRAVAIGNLERPGQNELERKLIEQRGVEHEKRVRDQYRSAGLSVVDIPLAPGAKEPDLAEAARATEAAMRDGADLICQGVLFDGSWVGRPDFLRKVPVPSHIGEHSYEVVDAKLARDAKATAVLQLCAYTELLARLQGREPSQFWLALGGESVNLTPLRVADYMAFYRQLKRELEAFSGDAARGDHCPEPVEHCDVCLWWSQCDQRRRKEDHLSLVAGISRRQRDRLVLNGVRSVAELAALANEVEGIARESLNRIREQASLQVKGRGSPTLIYEWLTDFEEGRGIESLPVPKPGDLFLDLEGDPFIGGDGLDYLFGLLELGEPSSDFDVRECAGEPRYRAFWATNPAEERRAFEAVIDRITEGLKEFQTLHVFHYGHRESDALKRLSCRYHTREEQVDDLLRRHVLVDLHRVVKQSLRASVEAYTLKELEGLHGFKRNVPIRDAAQAMQRYCWWLETGEGSDIEAQSRSVIERYNRDDCLSAWQLRDWLESKRPELERRIGRALKRPIPSDPETSDARQQSNEEMSRVIAGLIAALPEDPSQDTKPQAGQRLLANLLDWHWREAKSGWWEFFRTRDLPREDRIDDRAVLGNLRYVADLGASARSRLHRYDFEPQEHNLRVGKDVIDPDTEKRVGTVVELGETHIVLKRSATAEHPSALMLGTPVLTKDQRERMMDLGASVVASGLENFSEFAAARRLLLRQVPACGQAPGAALIPEGADTVQALCELALRLDGQVLAVQGPPGSGKSYHAAHVIVQLVKAGKRVGVTANSHQVITSLMAKAGAFAKQLGVPWRAVHHPGSNGGAGLESEFYELKSDHATNAARLRAGSIDVLGGTAWAWSRAGFRDALDVLVVDEAGQMSLANVLAVSHAANSLMLFGDPAQLEQPQKGVHPVGADVSALEHLLGDNHTLPDSAGVFLRRTWRLHPEICRFTSEAFYDGRLESVLDLELQTINGPGVFNGSGLRFVPVEHRGNTNRSVEEVDAIASLLGELFRHGARFVDKQGIERTLTIGDVRIVAPYNAQVATLQQRLPDFANVIGTVDKFQGQEAPIVIYSMTSSSADDAPRGMEFLYNLNRLNVATSRAQALVVLVASPELTRVHCKTPRQMRLVNALCRYLEGAGSNGCRKN
jgi:uncharacterized protein